MHGAKIQIADWIIWLWFL